MPPSAAVSPKTEITASPSLSERLDPSKTDVYKGLPEIAGDAATYTKDASQKIASGATHAMDMFNTSYANAAKGVMSYNVKILEIAQVNMRAALDHFHEISAVKSLPELIERSTANMRKQVELLSAQTQDLFGLGRKVFTEAAETIKPDVKKFD